MWKVVFFCALLPIFVTTQILSSKLFSYNANTFQLISSCTDEFDNIYFAGIFKGSIQLDTSQPILSSTGYIDSTSFDDIFVMKMDNSSVVLWSFSFGGISWEKFPSITYQNGTLFVAAATVSPTVYFTNPIIDLIDGSTKGKYILANINSTDGTILWAKLYPYSTYDEGSSPTALSLSVLIKDEFLYLTGSYYKWVRFDSLPLLQVPFAESFGTFLIKVDIITGIVLWSVSFSSLVTVQYSHLVIESDYIYVSGIMRDIGDYSGTTARVSEYYYLFISKVNITDGTIVYFQPVYTETAVTILHDCFLRNATEVVLVYESTSFIHLTTVNIELPLVVLNISYPKEYFNLVVGKDRDNNILISGLFNRTFSFPYLNPLVANGFSPDRFVVKIDSTAGIPIWSHAFPLYNSVYAPTNIVVLQNTNQIILSSSNFTVDLQIDAEMFQSVVMTQFFIPPNPLVSIKENTTARTTLNTQFEFEFTDTTRFSQLLICFKENCVNSSFTTTNFLVSLPSNTIETASIIPILEDGTLCEVSKNRITFSTKPSALFLTSSASSTTWMGYELQTEIGNIPFSIVANCRPLQYCPCEKCPLELSGRIGNLVPNVEYTFEVYRTTEYNESSERTIVAFTTLPLPVLSIEQIQRTDSIAQFSIAVNTTTVNQQVYYVCSTKVSQERTCSVLPITPVLYQEGLTPSQEYIFDVYILGTDSVTLSDVYSIVYSTLPAPSIITAISITTSSIILQIDIAPGQGNINQQWSFDVCIIYPNVTCINNTAANPSRATLQFDDLSIATSYDFVIVTYNANGDIAITTASFSTQFDPNLFALLSLLLLIPMLFCCVLIVILFAALLLYYIKTRKFKSSMSEFEEEEPLNIELYEQLAQEYVLDFSKLHYTASEALGAGAQATVYKATYFGIPVAAKVFLLKHFGVANDLHDFETEAKFLAEHSKHPNIVRFIGIAHHPESNRIALITELCQKGSLASYLLKHQTMEWKLKLHILYGIASGMNYLHHHQILHRDLKCENVLLDSNLSPKIIDFGLSKKIESVMDTQNMTMNVGTASYLAPEVLLHSQGQEQTPVAGSTSDGNSSTELNQSNSSVSSTSRHTYDSKVDVYSFAIIMWCLLHHNVRPYDSWTDIDIISKMSRFTTMRPNIDIIYGYEEEYQWYIELMKQCWDVDSSKRPCFENILSVLAGKTL